MRYKEQKSVDGGQTWEDTGVSFRSKVLVDDYINKATPYNILDWRAGWYWVLRRENDICPHFQVIKDVTKKG